MSCDICGQSFSAQRKPLCSSCAKAAVYISRIEQAAALLSRENAHTHIEAVVRPGNDGVIAALPHDADWDAISTAVKHHGVIRAKAAQETIENRINHITKKAIAVKEQMEAYRTWMSQQKDGILRRREELANESKELQRYKAQAIEPVESAIKKARHRLERLQNKTADARSVLCREAALLGGLRKTKGNDGHSEYWLGYVEIPDLRRLIGKGSQETGAHTSLNSKAHEDTTAAMDNIARLLCSCCQYLAIRLPAEIMLPTVDLSHATILPERSSYKFRDATNSGTTLYQSSNLSSSKVGAKSVAPRSRPLHLDRPLGQLLKDDAKKFHLFLEGAMLLAWNVAWLCKTQGIGNVNSFDEVCAIGRNLYQLALKTERTPRRSMPPGSNRSANVENKDAAKRNTPCPLGLFSHGTTHFTLQGSQGIELFQGWRLASSAPLIDKLKSYILNEISGAEWDVVQDDEWDDEQGFEQAVLVGGPRQVLDRKSVAMSVMNVTARDDIDEVQPRTEKSNTGSGWTKVRGR
ncbi:Hypothetical protein R9X50_00521300 [Acrodontium crateriforme]|uniref:Autophagy-related protein 14 n=1 Tax=Acrodontium crateriforme TaxID=150365 RepID=A0AAQ3M6Q1_9PEZI|nr:Hypothetical protein R9X50_00521300 [Acrodontium crateriforme]